MARTCLSHPKPSGALDIDVASRLAPLPLVLLLPDLAHLSRSERFESLRDMANLGLLGVSKGGRSNPHSDLTQNQLTSALKTRITCAFKGYIMLHPSSFIIHQHLGGWGGGSSYTNILGVCMHVYVCVCMCMYVYVCVCMCMYVYVYVCVCMCMYVYVCVCM